MAILTAPHNLVLYKIFKDYENYEKIVHTHKDLYDFSYKVIAEASKLSGEKLCMFIEDETYFEYYMNTLKEFCDVTLNHIVLNVVKYEQKKHLVFERLSALTGSLREGADIVFELEKQERLKAKKDKSKSIN